MVIVGVVPGVAVSLAGVITRRSVSVVVIVGVTVRAGMAAGGTILVGVMVVAVAVLPAALMRRTVPMTMPAGVPTLAGVFMAMRLRRRAFVLHRNAGLVLMLASAALLLRHGAMPFERIPGLSHVELRDLH